MNSQNSNKRKLIALAVAILVLVSVLIISVLVNNQSGNNNQSVQIDDSYAVFSSPFFSINVPIDYSESGSFADVIYTNPDKTESIRVQRILDIDSTETLNAFKNNLGSNLNSEQVNGREVLSAEQKLGENITSTYYIIDTEYVWRIEIKSSTKSKLFEDVQKIISTFKPRPIKESAAL